MDNPMLRCHLFLVATIAGLLSACEKDGCGGATCPFAEPTHQAVVRGVVLDLNDQPLEGIHTSVLYVGEARSGVGTQTDRLGRFTATARTDLGDRPDTASAWVRATQANPPPAAVVSDSVRVLLHFTRRTEPPVIVPVTVHLPVGP
jgi:hypothetical protein